MPSKLENAKALSILADEELVGWSAINASPQVAEWLRELTRWSGEPQAWIEDGTLRVRLYTARHKFCLFFRPPDDDEGWIGAGAWTRTPRIGEEHCRGNGLHDGVWSEETWRLIVADMLAYELRPLAKSATRGRPARPVRKRNR